MLCQSDLKTVDSSTIFLFQALYPEGEEVCDVSGQSAIPVPPEVKRIAVNKNSGETLLHRAARLGNEVSDTAVDGWMNRCPQKRNVFRECSTHAEKAVSDSALI